jgi:uncharacterized protein (DUF305 family)
MKKQPLLFALIGFLAGGLLVSTAFVTFNKPVSDDSMSSMMAALEGKTGDEFDKAFLNQMIMHHQGAVDMAKAAENQAGHQEIKDLSTNIIIAQEKEIGEMQMWQGDWGFPTMNHSTGDMSH